MDKPTENNVKLNYDRGWRAYDIHGTTQKFFQNSNTGTYWLLSDEDHTDWYDLRSYQDAERKKGVPIVHTTLADDNNWRMLRNRYRTPNRQIYFGSYLESQDTPEDGPRRPYIKLYTESGADLALFTNFRWREGYPKGGKNAGVRHSGK